MIVDELGNVFGNMNSCMAYLIEKCSKGNREDIEPSIGVTETETTELGHILSTKSSLIFDEVSPNLTPDTQLNAMKSVGILSGRTKNSLPSPLPIIQEV